MTSIATKRMRLSYRLALVAQGIEHRFPKPLGVSAVPWRRMPVSWASSHTEGCELCAQTRSVSYPQPCPHMHDMPSQLAGVSPGYEKKLAIAWVSSENAHRCVI